ncbi:MAG TPA: FtsX-like permease family protein [Microlunatus sp.]
MAAGFGIVNTLLMSVSERSREIGLLKAMGLGGGRIFTLFSMEAVFIGFLGSAIGAGAAVLVGTIVNGVLAGCVLAGLPGLTVLAFAPATVLGIVALVMGIAFVAGSIPALRAARQDPIESLRYE